MNVYKKITYIGIILLVLCACKNTSKKVKPQKPYVNIIKEIEIDSAKVYILDETIYACMNDLFSELEGGSDSNIIIQKVVIPEIDDIGYYFHKESDDNFINPWGEGITRFYASKKDSIFIEQQLNSNKDKQWVVENFQGIPYDSAMLAKYESGYGFDWDKFKKDGYGCFESFSLPIFNVDSTQCIIQINGSCHGTLGSGYSMFLEKKDGKWKVVGRKQNWMS